MLGRTRKGNEVAIPSNKDSHEYKDSHWTVGISFEKGTQRERRYSFSEDELEQVARNGSHNEWANISDYSDGPDISIVRKVCHSTWLDCTMHGQWIALGSLGKKQTCFAFTSGL